MGSPVVFRAWEKVLAKASWSFEAIYLGPKVRHYNNGGGGGGAGFAIVGYTGRLTVYKMEQKLVLYYFKRSLKQTVVLP